MLVLQVCLGADADDQFHTVEIEGVTYDGKTARVPLAVLKPSVLPSVSGSRITVPCWCSRPVVPNPGPWGSPVLHVLDVSLLQHT